ncbi:hypothetical protein [Streptomyces sp. NPDC003006]
MLADGFVGHHSSAHFVPLDTADDWPHFGLGSGMLALGTLLTRGSNATR